MDPETDVNMPEADPSAASSPEGAQGQPNAGSPEGQAQSLDSVVKAAFDKSQSPSDQADATTEPSTEPAPEGNQTDASPEDKTQADPTKQPTDDPTKPIPYTRFKEVNDAKKVVEDKLASQSKAIESYQTIVDHCVACGANQEDFEFWMKVMALDKLNPLEALKLLAPKVQSLQTISGDLLPKEYQEAVDRGEMSEAFAKRLAAAEGKQRISAQQAELANQARLEQMRVQTTQAAQTALENWATAKQSSDPDFQPTKAGLPKGKWEIFMQSFETAANKANGSIRSVNDLITLADRCYQDTEAFFSRFSPKVQGQRTVRSNQSNGVNTAPPKSLKEAVERAAAKHGVGAA